VAPSTSNVGVAIMPGDAGVHRDIIGGTNPKDLPMAWRFLFGDKSTVNIGNTPNGSMKDAWDILKADQVPDFLAAGILANIQKESGFDPNMDHVDGNGLNVHGLGSWNPERQARFKAWKGYDIRQSSFKDQVEFFLEEMSNEERQAGNLIGNPSSPYHAGADVSRYYERPGNTEKEMEERGSLAEKIYQQMMNRVDPNPYGVLGKHSSRDTNIKITLDNRTGNNAILSVQQLAIPT
jgi:hypothetical protein